LAREARKKNLNPRISRYPRIGCMGQVTAMEAGVAHHVWSIEVLVGLVG
jgi:hypothetical protein